MIPSVCVLFLVAVAGLETDLKVGRRLYKRHCYFPNQRFYCHPTFYQIHMLCSYNPDNYHQLCEREALEHACLSACQQSCQTQCPPSMAKPICQSACSTACVSSCQNTQLVPKKSSAAAANECPPACQPYCTAACLQQNNDIVSPVPQYKISCLPACQPLCDPQCVQTSCIAACRPLCTPECIQTHCLPACQPLCTEQCIQAHCQPTCQPSCSSNCIQTQCVPACQPLCELQCITQHCPISCQPECNTDCIHARNSLLPQEVQKLNNSLECSTSCQERCANTGKTVLPSDECYKTCILCCYQNRNPIEQCMQTQQPELQISAPTCVHACQPECSELCIHQYQNEMGCPLWCQPECSPTCTAACPAECKPFCSPECAQRYQDTAVTAQNRSNDLVEPSLAIQNVSSSETIKTVLNDTAEQGLAHKTSCFPSCTISCKEACLAKMENRSVDDLPSPLCNTYCEQTCPNFCEQYSTVPSGDRTCISSCMPGCQPECIFQMEPQMFQFSCPPECQPFCAPDCIENQEASQFPCTFRCMPNCDPECTGNQVTTQNDSKIGTCSNVNQENLSEAFHLSPNSASSSPKNLSLGEAKEQCNGLYVPGCGSDCRQEFSQCFDVCLPSCIRANKSIDGTPSWQVCSETCIPRCTSSCYQKLTDMKVQNCTWYCTPFCSSYDSVPSVPKFYEPASLVFDIGDHAHQVQNHSSYLLPSCNFSYPSPKPQYILDYTQQQQYSDSQLKYGDFVTPQMPEQEKVTNSENPTAVSCFRSFSNLDASHLSSETQVDQMHLLSALEVTPKCEAKSQEACDGKFPNGTPEKYCQGEPEVACLFSPLELSSCPQPSVSSHIGLASSTLSQSYPPEMQQASNVVYTGCTPVCMPLCMPHCIEWFNPGKKIVCTFPPASPAFGTAIFSGLHQSAKFPECPFATCLPKCTDQCIQREIQSCPVPCRPNCYSKCVRRYVIDELRKEAQCKENGDNTGDWDENVEPQIYPDYSLDYNSPVYIQYPYADQDQGLIYYYDEDSVANFGKYETTKTDQLVERTDSDDMRKDGEQSSKTEFETTPAATESTQENETTTPIVVTSTTSPFDTKQDLEKQLLIRPRSSKSCVSKCSHSCKEGCANTKTKRHCPQPCKTKCLHRCQKRRTLFL